MACRHDLGIFFTPCRVCTTSSEVSRHIHIHATTDGPSIDLENTNILAVEPRWFERGVKEAIHIRAASPTLNKDGGRYQLPTIWNNIIKERVKRRETGNPTRGAQANAT